MPYEEECEYLQKERILVSDYEWPEGLTVSPKMQDLIFRIFKPSKDQRRYDLNEIENHAFFTGFKPLPDSLPK